LRPSIGGLTPVAEGATLTLEITLVDVRKACVPLAGHAVYLWQCDAEGVYSIYNAGDRNYLRGVGISDAQGRVRFTSVFPGCYPGRWPHLHFEVFASAEAAVSGRKALLTSQFALPEPACATVYAADARCAASRAPLQDVDLASDGIFRNGSATERAAQLLAVEGDPESGYRGRGQVGLLL
jgi:protocatechuate 3,4-dioxygenase beta subunit